MARARMSLRGIDAKNESVPSILEIGGEQGRLLKSMPTFAKCSDK